MKTILIAFVACLAVLFVVPHAEATYGVDISSASDISDFQCLASAGYDFVIIRGWQSFGAADPNCPHSIYNAKDGGMKDIDVYLFPCAGKSASDQVSEMVSYLASYKADYGKIWFDIETNPSSGCGWSSNTGDNCDFLTDLIAEAKKLGKSPGVYASSYMWDSIMGSGCTAGHSGGADLWYAHYDDDPSFSDFQPFGGWSTPSIKQYEGSVTVCGLGVDKNWYP